MSTRSTPANYMATSHAPPTAHTQSTHHTTSSSSTTTTVTAATTESESYFDKSYLVSIRAILKYTCLLFCFTGFVCVVSTPQCGGYHTFVASVTFLVLIMQMLIIIVFGFRLQTKILGIDFELLDLFATSQDAVYLLISSSILIHYCRIPGQLAGASMGIVAFFLLLGDAIMIVLARRQEAAAAASTTNSGMRSSSK